MNKQILSAFLSLLCLFAFSSINSTEKGIISVQHAPNPEHIITNVGNFTIIDTDGVSRNLYQSLDEGNTILIFILNTT